MERNGIEDHSDYYDQRAVRTSRNLGDRKNVFQCMMVIFK